MTTRWAMLWATLSWLAAADDAGAQIPVPTAPSAVAPIMFAGGKGAAYQIVTTADGQKFVGPVQNNGALAYGRKSGLQMSLAMTWCGQYGYWPLEVTFKSRRPAATDKQILFRFYAGGWQNRGKSITVEQSLTLKTGDRTTSATILTPHYETWQVCGWEATVDGQRMDELNVDFANFGAMQGAGGGIAALGVSLNPVDGNLATILQSLGGGQATLRQAKSAELPTDWIYYSALDLVIMPAHELPRLVQRQPTQGAALLRWVRSGGNLWLLDAQNDWSRLAEADAVFAPNEPATEGDAPASAQTLGTAAWRFLPVGPRGADAVAGALILSRFITSGATPASSAGINPGVAQATGNDPPTAARQPGTRRIKARPYGLGVVAAFAHGVPTDRSNTAQVAESVSQSLLGPRGHRHPIWQRPRRL